MAKRKSNKSEEIRQYFAAHPDAAAPEIAEALKVAPALIYNVKAAMKRKSVQNGSGRKGKKGVSAAAGGVDEVVAAAKLIQSCGSIERAKQALTAAQKVAEAFDA